MKIELTEQDLGMTIAMLSVIITTFADDANVKSQIKEIEILREKIRLLLDESISKAEFESIERGGNAVH